MRIEIDRHQRYRIHLGRIGPTHPFEEIQVKGFGYFLADELDLFGAEAGQFGRDVLLLLGIDLTVRLGGVDHCLHQHQRLLMGLRRVGYGSTTHAQGSGQRRQRRLPSCGRSAEHTRQRRERGLSGAAATRGALHVLLQGGHRQTAQRRHDTATDGRLLAAVARLAAIARLATTRQTAGQLAENLIAHVGRSGVVAQQTAQ